MTIDALYSWVLENCDRIDLRIEETRSDLNLSPAFFRHVAKINYKGVERIGIGGDTDEQTSIVKAVVESFESCSFYQYESSDVKTSNGFASHTNLQLAAQNSIYELLERDFFLCYYLTGTPFQLADLSNVDEAVHLFIEYSSQLKKVGIILELRRMLTQEGVNSYVCAAFGKGYKKPFGCVIGSSCAENRNDAIYQALFEVIRSLSMISCLNKITYLNIEEFEELNKYQPRHHSLLFFHLDVAEKFADSYFYKSQVNCDVNVCPPSVLENISVEQIETLDEFSDSPIVTTRAYSDEVQSLYFGETDIQKINLNRLRQFINSQLFSFEDAETFPHPLS